MRIDFYLLTDVTPEAKWLLACRVLEKAYRQGHQVFVYCSHLSEAEHLDELLWTYKADSFVPHHLQGEGPEPAPPIQIGYAEEPRGFHDILLNLASTVPAFYNRFKRVIEIVPAEDEQAKTQSRDHFRSYRQAGYSPTTHTISATAT